MPIAYADDNPLIMTLRTNPDLRVRGFRLFYGDDYGGSKMVVVPNKMEGGHTGFEGVELGALDTLCGNNELAWQTIAPGTTCLAVVEAVGR